MTDIEDPSAPDADEASHSVGSAFMQTLALMNRHVGLSDRMADWLGRLQSWVLILSVVVTTLSAGFAWAIVRIVDLSTQHAQATLVLQGQVRELAARVADMDSRLAIAETQARQGDEAVKALGDVSRLITRLNALGEGRGSGHVQ